MANSKFRKGVTLDKLPPHHRAEAERQLREQAQKGPGSPSSRLATPVSTPSAGQDTPKAKKRGKKRREMNQTEREFLAYLKREHPEADSIEYEEFTLRWGEGAGLLTYTPDFVVTYKTDIPRGFALHFIFYEVKGAHAWPQDIVKFKAARAHFKRMRFELWEKAKDGIWSNTI